MEEKFRIQISTGPLEEDWLVAEILFGEEHIADVVEWGEKMCLYPRLDGKYWKIPVDEFLETIKIAKERVRYIPKDSES